MCISNEQCHLEKTKNAVPAQSIFCFFGVIGRTPVSLGNQRFPRPALWTNDLSYHA